ncbi:PspC domain-containing protein [Sporichthya brevicatena]
MTEHLGPTATPPPPSTASAPPPPGPRRFRRSRSDRVLAGVCGGLAESLALDPVIVRVLMVVLSFFGGAGLIVYLACWLLMPEDDRDTSLAERVIARGGSNPWPVLLLAAVLGLAAVLSMGWVVDDRGLLLIALFVITAVVLARRESPPAAAPPPFTAPPFTPPPADPTAGPTPPAPTGWGETGYPAPAGGWAPTAPLPPLAPAPPAPPAAPRERSILGRLTFCLVLIALGALGMADLAGSDVPTAAYPALVLAGAGAGLLIGTRYGRGRWLIALGVVGALALPPAVFVDAYRGGWADHEHAITPLSAAEIASKYEYRGGLVRLDFTQVDFTDQDVSTAVEVGVGDLELVVPPNVDVVTDVDLGIGSVEVFDSEHSGFGVSRSGRDDGADGPGGGRLTVRIEQGIGHVEVRRAAA